MADDDILESDDILGGGGEQDPHRVQKRKEREERVLDRFKASHTGLQRVFRKHFGDENPDVETLSYHLASAEAKLPNVKEAIRLARYPGAGDRDAKRFAMGLWENLSVLSTHLHRAMESLENLSANGERSGSSD